MKKVILFILLLAASMSALAQQLTVSGTVHDENGDPFPGVVVFAKDRPGGGTMTDIDGKFTIKVGKNDILVFSSIGYEKSYYIMLTYQKQRSY